MQSRFYILELEEFEGNPMDVSNQPHALYNTTDSEWSINKFHYIIFIYLRTQILHTHDMYIRTQNSAYMYKTFII